MYYDIHSYSQDNALYNRYRGYFLHESPAGYKTFRIQAHHNNPENRYIQSAKLNGKEYTKCYLDYQDIMKGGVLELEMGPNPNKDWGI